MSTYPEEGFSSSKKEGRIGITDAEELTSEPESSNDPSTWNSRFLDAVEKFWLFEFFGWTLALGSLMGIVALLVVYDGEESPNWTLKVGAGRHRKTLGLTINTIISIFATAFNSGLLIPVAASMSQLKWVWFQKGGRPLAHYQSFDSAARGPLGSVVLLWTLRCRRLACLGALIIIAALGIGFSFQALVVYPLRPVPVDVAKISRTNYNQGSDLDPLLMDNNMLGGIYAGLYKYTDKSEMSFSCPTGNCTWPQTYTTMGICGKCYDVTSSLNETCGTAEVLSADDGVNPVVNVTLPYCNYTLPNGLHVSGVPAVNFTLLNITGNTANAVHFDEATTFSVLSSIRADWSVYIPQWADLNPNPSINGIDQKYATECGLSFCVQKFNTSVSQGKLNETLLDTYATGGFDDNYLGNYVLQPPPSFTNKSNTGDANVYQSNSFNRLSEFFSKHWEGSYIQLSATAEVVPSSDVAQFLSTLFFEQYEQIVSSLTKSMTDTIRAQSLSTSDKFPTADGVAYQDRPHVQVRWAWLAFPATLLGLALILLVATMVTNARQKTLLWKGSSLAAFSHPLTSDARTQVSDVASPRDVLKIAQKLDVKWEKTDRGFRLVRPHDSE